MLLGRSQACYYWWDASNPIVDKFAGAMVTDDGRLLSARLHVPTKKQILNLSAADLAANIREPEI